MKLFLSLLLLPLLLPAVDFTQSIRPILSDKCFSCHGPGDAKGKLRLHTLEEATKPLGPPDGVE